MVKNGGYTNLDTATILTEKYIGPIEEASGYALYIGDKQLMPDDLKKLLSRGHILLKRSGDNYTSYVGIHQIMYDKNGITIRFLIGPEGVAEYFYTFDEPDCGFYR